MNHENPYQIIENSSGSQRIKDIRFPEHAQELLASLQKKLPLKAPVVTYILYRLLRNFDLRAGSLPFLSFNNLALIALVVLCTLYIHRGTTLLQLKQKPRRVKAKVFSGTFALTALTCLILKALNNVEIELFAQQAQCLLIVFALLKFSLAYFCLCWPRQYRLLCEEIQLKRSPQCWTKIFYGFALLCIIQALISTSMVLDIKIPDWCMLALLVSDILTIICTPLIFANLHGMYSFFSSLIAHQPGTSKRPAVAKVKFLRKKK